MFSKVLIANRGEIAVRIIRSLRELGIKSVAVYSEADREALHVRMADEAYCIGPAPSSASYLQIDTILDVVRQSGAEAVHPGYGFLSENAAFATACAEAGIVFIGPPPAAIDAMGEKTRARQLMAEAGVPLVPGTKEAVADADEALEIARGMGFPVLIKAAAGGGGKGMRRVGSEAEFKQAFVGAAREALNSFANADVYIEKYVINPKHVEIQVLADTHGNVVHLFERDCSVQRRHQKIIEEAPCPVLSEDVRQKMGAVAVQAARAVNYVGAGTVEFLLDANQDFYFLEMNTRLQVEHPVTEMITSLDLVRWQVKIAAGEVFPFSQDELNFQGAAIECRIYAENPAENFRPAPGYISFLSSPFGPGVREDSGVASGSEVTIHYDPMIAKLIAWGEDRPHAIARMKRALSEYIVSGIDTNIAFHHKVLNHPGFIGGDYDTEFVPNMLKSQNASVPEEKSSDVPWLDVAAVIGAHIKEEQLLSSGGHRSDSPGRAAAGRSSSNWKYLGRHRRLRQ